MQDVTLAILMELCQYGTLYNVMNQARRVKHINQDIRSGRLPVNYLQNSELKVCPTVASFEHIPDCCAAAEIPQMIQLQGCCKASALTEGHKQPSLKKMFCSAAECSFLLCYVTVL